MSEPTKGPWKAVQCGGERGGYYFEIRGPNDEAIATLFAHARMGGVGINAAQANAEWIALHAPAQEGSR